MLLAKNERVLIDLWFPNDYYNILDCTSVDFKEVIFSKIIILITYH